MDQQGNSRAVDRRQLLRGAGLVGGAAALAAVGAVATAPSAEAADGGDLLIGEANNASTTTGLTIAPGAAPALGLANSDGPQLNLTPDDAFSGDLALGDILNTSSGPLIGANFGDGLTTSFLVTPNDLPYLVPVPVAFAPVRVLDTRTTAGRKPIVRKSTGALTSAGQLVAGHWIDIAVDSTTNDYDVSGLYYNLTVVSPLASGYVSIYAPSGGSHPATSTINFRTGVNLANGGFGAVETYSTDYVVRIYASQTTHLLLDVTGEVLNSTDGGDDAAAAKARTRALARARRAGAITRRPLRTRSR